MTKTVFITGASRGVGKAVALLFSRQGWNVVATARAPVKLETWANSAQILELRVDVTDEHTIASAVAEAKRCFGSVDVLVNNAGFGLAGAFESMSNEQLHRIFEVNFFGAASTIRHVVPLMRQQGSGVIVRLLARW